MILPQADEIVNNPLPNETAASPVVTQRHLDECTRALGRPLWDFEFGILQDMLLTLEGINRKALKKGIIQGFSMDELVNVFIERVQQAESKAAQLKAALN
jgi:hypothetical protein